MNHTRDFELNKIGVLTRREIEVRTVAPSVDARCREFGREKVLQIVAEPSWYKGARCALTKTGEGHIIGEIL